MLNKAVIVATPDPFQCYRNWFKRAASIALATLTIRVAWLTLGQAGVATLRVGTLRQAVL